MSKLSVPMSKIAFAYAVGTTSLLFAGYAQAQPLALGPQSKTVIVLPRNATPAEQTAARDLDNYLTKVTGGDFTVANEPASAQTAIFVGATQFAKTAGIDTKALASEEWRIKTQNGNLVLAGGGTRGTLYATYRFLEDEVGVRWWNPWEEHVPARKTLTFNALDKSGKPAFAYRDIYMTYGYDNGRFAIRNRLNRDGMAPVTAEYGGSRDYGPPDHAHTFYLILPPAEYFKDHPDWFILPEGESPTYRNSQLKLSHPGMRSEFLKRFKAIIRQSQQEARAKGLPLPDAYSVSQEDNRVSFATADDTALIAENGGAESAVLIDFLNYLSDGIKDEFPGVNIDTLAYFAGEKAPTKIRPRDNIIIRLTDTTSNLIVPITHPLNKRFREDLEAWSKLSNNVRVWDYAVTFTYPGLPMPTTPTYPADLRYWKEHNIEGIFVEHEFPILADMRDFKVWLLCKLYEDPYHDYDALVKEFTDGFYGPAGVHVRRYIYALNNEAERIGKAKGYEDINWTVPAKPYNYLSVDFLLRADKMFAEAVHAAGDDAVLQRRVRHARLSLDRYMAVMQRSVLKQWKKKGNAPETLPLNYEEIGARYLKAWNEQIDIRIAEVERDSERKVASDEVQKLIGTKLPPIPSRFAGISPDKVEVYGPGATRNYRRAARLIEDPQAELDIANRLRIEDTPENEQAKYNLPMQWGVYDNTKEKVLVSNVIERADIPGPGYHWYKLGETPLTGNDTLYLFWSWWIQLDLGDGFDEENPQKPYEVWANIKFEGPMFPHGRDDEKNAISVERIVLVQQ